MRCSWCLFVCLPLSLVSRCLLVIIFPYFAFHLCLFDGICFQYYQVLVIFSLSKILSFSCVSFITFHYQNGSFLNANFPFYILAVDFYCFYQGFQSFCILCNDYYNYYYYYSLLESNFFYISDSLQDSSVCSGRCEQCCSLDSLHSSSNFQVLRSLQ